MDSLALGSVAGDTAWVLGVPSALLTVLHLYLDRVCVRLCTPCPLSPLRRNKGNHNSAVPSAWAAQPHLPPSVRMCDYKQPQLRQISLGECRKLNHEKALLQGQSTALGQWSFQSYLAEFRGLSKHKTGLTRPGVGQATPAEHWVNFPRAVIVPEPPPLNLYVLQYT